MPVENLHVTEAMNESKNRGQNSSADTSKEMRKHLRSQVTASWLGDKFVEQAQISGSDPTKAPSVDVALKVYR